MLPPSPRSQEPVWLLLGAFSKLNQGERVVCSCLELGGRVVIFKRGLWER